jgi:hypothetical protein
MDINRLKSGSVSGLIHSGSTDGRWKVARMKLASSPRDCGDRNPEQTCERSDRNTNNSSRGADRLTVAARPAHAIAAAMSEI